MQLYTRTGDQGFTKIVGGSHLAKDSKRIEAYGSIDELNSLIGYAATQLEKESIIYKELAEIQQLLFDCGNDLATPINIGSERLLPENVEWLESLIDVHSQEPPQLTEFIIPGGTELAGLFHYIRAVARRVERRIVSFQWVEEINPFVLKFVNRLSDYFYAIARVMNHRNNVSDVAYERSGKVFHDISKEDLEK